MTNCQDKWYHLQNSKGIVAKLTETLISEIMPPLYYGMAIPTDWVVMA